MDVLLKIRVFRYQFLAIQQQLFPFLKLNKVQQLIFNYDLLCRYRLPCLQESS